MILLQRSALFAAAFMLGSLGSATGVLAAASLYVTDSVSVGVYDTAELLGDPVQRLISGTPLEVLQSVDGIAQIKTSSGTVGWVRSSFVSSQVPAAHRLDKALTKIDGLQQEIIEAYKTIEKSEAHIKELQKLKWVRGELKKARATIERLKANQAGEKVAQDEHAGTLLALQEQVEALSNHNTDLLNRVAASELIAMENASLQLSMQEPPERGLPWLIGLVGLIFGLAVGFIAGYRWLARRIDARFGGMTLY